MQASNVMSAIAGAGLTAGILLIFPTKTVVPCQNEIYTVCLKEENKGKWDTSYKTVTGKNECMKFSAKNFVINEEFAFTYITNRYNPSETYIYKDLEIEKSWFVCADSVRATNKGKPVSLPEAK